MSQKKLKKRPDGRYRVYYLGKQFYGKTKEEAMKKRDDYIAAENGNVSAVSPVSAENGNVSAVSPVPADNTTVQQKTAQIAQEIQTTQKTNDKTFIEYGLEWVDAYRSQCIPMQHNQYIRVVNVVGEKLGNKKMSDITSTDLQRFVNTLTVYSPSHVNKYMITLRGIFKTAFAEGIIDRNPMEVIKRPRTKKCEGHRALEEWERELITSTWSGHDFGLCAMVMLYAGLRRGEALYIDVDRDCDFEKKTITVHGSLAFDNGNQPEISEGKTANAQRTIPMVKPLADALRGHHGLICAKEDGTLMTQIAFKRKYDSYLTYLEEKVNGCHKRWYGLTKEHKKILESGGTLPEWKEVNIRCHDFRVDFCTRAYYAGIPLKTLQKWMGHADTTMILRVYTKTLQKEEDEDALKLAEYMEKS